MPTKDAAAESRADRIVFALLLAALAMLGPFSIDTYMPSFPDIGGTFGASALELQFTISAFLATWAVMALFHGAIADSFGRRPVILVNLGVFVAASVGCAMAAALDQLLWLRALQGLAGGAGLIVGRAMIRDSFEGAEAQRMMSTVTMIFGLAPAAAPIVGGWLQAGFGWRSVFVFLAVYGALLFAACAWRLRETLPAAERQPFVLPALLANYLMLARNARFWLLSSAIAFNFCGFFLYIAAAPSVVYEWLGLGGMAASLQAFQHSLFTAIVAAALVPQVAGSAFAAALASAGLLGCGALCAAGELRRVENRHA